jgi:hypothetical protein
MERYGMALCFVKWSSQREDIVENGKERNIADNGERGKAQGANGKAPMALSSYERGVAQGSRSDV